MQALVERQMEGADFHHQVVGLLGWRSNAKCKRQLPGVYWAKICLLLLACLWKQTVWLFSIFFTCVPRCVHPPTPFALDCCMHLYQCWVYFILFIYSAIPQKDIKYLSRPHPFELVMQNNQTLVKERTRYKMSEEWSSSLAVWFQRVAKASVSALFLKAATAALS